MKFRKILLSSALALSSITLLANAPAEAQAAPATKVVAQETAKKWVDLGTHQNVDLNKVWTINFSKTVSFNKIEAISVKSGNTFVPVKMVKNAQTQLQVIPILGYVGNTTYEMKIYLSNGLNYKMTFTTKKAARDADKEPNNTYLQGQTIFANDHVKGTLNQKDGSDFYKVVVPADGRLDVQAISSNGSNLDLYVYGAEGNDGKTVRAEYSKLTATASMGLAAGTYYIRVYKQADTTYDLTTTFTENETLNDKATANYVQAHTLALNSEVTGHIGYIDDSVTMNNHDYYKIILPENGTLNIEAIQQDGGKLDFYLYGKNGTDGKTIRADYDESTHTESVRLQAGTYYVRLYSNNNYGSYSIKNTFTPEAVQNDRATSSYVTAPQLALNTTATGHLGHFDENGNVNSDDYYKIVVSKAGTLNLQVKHLQGRNVDMYLYGANGTDGRTLDTAYDVQHDTVSAEVTPGTYYVRLHNSGEQGTYEIEASVQ